MPVDDHPVSDIVRFKRLPLAGCNTEREGRVARNYEPQFTAFAKAIFFRMSTLCRQIGVKTSEGWRDLPECAGCKELRDEPFIADARDRIDSEFRKAST